MMMMLKKSGLDFQLNKGFVSLLRGGISDNLNHKKTAQMSSRKKHDEYHDDSILIMILYDGAEQKNFGSQEKDYSYLSNKIKEDEMSS